MKTIEDLTAALAKCSDAMGKLSTAFTNQAPPPPPMDYASIVSIVESITAQVVALTLKLTPAPAPAAPPPAPPPAA